MKHTQTLAALTLGALAAATAAQAAPLHGFTLIRATPKTLSQAQVTAGMKTVTGTVSPDRKMIAFTDKTARLLAVTGPDNDMLSYRMDGLRNPTIVVPKGATLDVLFINTDDDMFHNIRFGAGRASWPADASPLLKTSVGTPPLPHGTDAARHAEETVLRVPLAPGKYAYFCTVRGHAQGGMVGQIIVR